MMPLSCDCFSGCWGVHSKNWPALHIPQHLIDKHAEHRYPDSVAAGEIIHACAIPYGSCVNVSGELRLETQELFQTVKTYLESLMTSTNLTFARVSEINIERCNHWHNLEDWDASQWGVAFAGEAGEVCNAIKKLNRLDMGIQQNAVSASREELIKAIALEIGDTYLYMDLLCQRLGINIEFAIIDTFNRVSKRENMVERLP